MSTHTDGRQRLLQALRKRTPEMKDLLSRLKKRGQQSLGRDDFLWHFLLQSFSTMGNSRGWDGLIGNEDNYRQVQYDAVKNLSDAERSQRFDTVLRAAKVRMPGKKAVWLASNFRKIQALGGLEKANELATSAPGREAKIAFLKHFEGIGPKYARNIWMDVYHPDFRQAIAIDERIQKVTSALGLTFPNYASHEQFYLDLAREAELTGWELDRLLYNYRDHFLRSIDTA